MELKEFNSTFNYAQCTAVLQGGGARGHYTIQMASPYFSTPTPFHNFLLDFGPQHSFFSLVD